jgi:thiamine biosynthesis lipoprotein ApbE
MLTGRRSGACRRHYEHVLGTSMELTVWGPAAAVTAAETAVLDELERLDQLLSTYRADSEISRLGDRDLGAGSTERAALLGAYDEWRHRSAGAIDDRIRGRLNVDALGKSFIVDRVADSAIRAGVEGVLLNIGGDIVTRGVRADIDVTDPARPFDTDPPIARVRLTDGAIATSGAYARSGHLVDPRTGGTARGAASASVIAGDCVTANALATALCVLPASDGLALVERVGSAEALLISRDGIVTRTRGFAALEQDVPARPASSQAWPAGFEVRIALTLTGQASGGRSRGLKSPYVAIWIEDARGKYVRTVAVWGDKWRYLAELTDWWAIARNDPALNTTATRATRPAGEYRVAWNGLADSGEHLPQGSYKIHVEVSREHGTYARKAAVIACAAAPATATLPETAEFAPIVVTYGPRS